MAEPGFPRVLLAGPLLWAAMGATAALALGVPQDFGLFAMPVAGVYLLVHKGERTAPSPR